MEGFDVKGFPPGVQALAELLNTMPDHEPERPRSAHTDTPFADFSAGEEEETDIATRPCRFLGPTYPRDDTHHAHGLQHDRGHPYMPEDPAGLMPERMMLPPGYQVPQYPPMYPMHGYTPTYQPQGYLRPGGPQFTMARAQHEPLDGESTQHGATQPQSVPAPAVASQRPQSGHLEHHQHNPTPFRLWHQDTRQQHSHQLVKNT